MATLPLPKNLPLLIGENERNDILINRIMSGGQSDIDNMIDLSLICPVKVTFKEEVAKDKKKAREHIFKSFFVSKTGNFCYANRRNPRTGRPFPAPISMIESYEPAFTSTYSIEFKNFEDFKKKFDTFFITEDEIKKLWNSKSSQHGGKYNKNDFRGLSPSGKYVMEKFLRNFKGINNGGGTGYVAAYDETHKSLREYHHAYSHTGRDIKIVHQTNLDWVCYSSEYPGCGNGRYGLIANKNTYLWLEDD